MNQTEEMLVFVLIVGFCTVIFFPIWYPIRLVMDWNKGRKDLKKKRLNEKRRA